MTTTQWATLRAALAVVALGAVGAAVASQMGAWGGTRAGESDGNRGPSRPAAEPPPAPVRAALPAPQVEPAMAPAHAAKDSPLMARVSRAAARGRVRVTSSGRGVRCSVDDAVQALGDLLQAAGDEFSGSSDPDSDDSDDEAEARLASELARPGGLHARFDYTVQARSGALTVRFGEGCVAQTTVHALR